MVACSASCPPSRLISSATWLKVCWTRLPITSRALTWIELQSAASTRVQCWIQATFSLTKGKLLSKATFAAIAVLPVPRLPSSSRPSNDAEELSRTWSRKRLQVDTSLVYSWPQGTIPPRRQVLKSSSAQPKAGLHSFIATRKIFIGILISSSAIFSKMLASEVTSTLPVFLSLLLTHQCHSHSTRQTSHSNGVAALIRHLFLERRLDCVDSD